MMIGSMLRSLFGTANDRYIKSLKKEVDAINAFEPEMQSLSDEELKAKTDYFREKLKNGFSLDDILPEAFAVVREAAVRTLKLRPFDVQLLGGIVLHKGKIAEMKNVTLDEKTLAEQEKQSKGIAVEIIESISKSKLN